MRGGRLALLALFVLLLGLLGVLLWTASSHAQTGNFKQIIMQDVTGAFTRFTRINMAQRDASTHNVGEVIWCTDCTPVSLWVYDGTQWVPLGGGGTGPGGGLEGVGNPTEVAIWNVANTSLLGDPLFKWTTIPPSVLNKAVLVGTVPQGDLRPGNIFSGLNAPSTSTGMQNLMLQTYQGAPGLAGLVTLGDDRVGLSSWNFRGTGASNPIYGANFGVVFNTNGVANGLEIDVQNDSATNFQGQALWLNGSTRAVGASGTVGHRANAILIDTQDGSKWDRGILFKEGFVAAGATGTIATIGIHFERNQDSDFIAIQPRTGTAGNIAFKLTNPEFTVNRFTLLNSGAIRVGNTMTGSAFPSYAFVEDQTTGLYMEADAVLGFAIKREITCPVTVPPQVPPCFAGERRMTLGAVDGPPTGPAALNLWPWGTGANQGGTLNLFDPSSVHSVGFMAPDFVAGLGSFRIRLPAEPGPAGQCVLTSGPTGAAGAQIETWSYGACGTGGGGGGGTVTNTGVLGANQVILGNGGVDIKGMGSLGTGTTVLHGNVAGGPTWGPIQLADLNATGTPTASTFLAGDWSWKTVAGAGTVTTSGVPLSGQVSFFTGATVISGDAHMQWSNLNKSLRIGLPNDATSPSQALSVAGRSTGGLDPVQSVYAAFAGASPTLNHPVPLTLIGDFLGGGQMPVGFGVTLELGLHDYGGTGTIAAGYLNAAVQVRSPATTSVTLGAQIAGAATPLMTLDNAQALFSRQVTSSVTAAVLPQGGTFHAVKNYAGAAVVTDEGIGQLLFSGAGMSPAVTGAAAAVLANVDGAGATRLRGRLSWHVSNGTDLIERMRLTSAGALVIGSGTTGVAVENQTPLFVTAANTGSNPLVRLEANAAGAGAVRTVLALVRSTTGAMVDGFGIRQDFILRDSDAVDSVVGRFVVSRQGLLGGADNAGHFQLQTMVGGALANRFVIDYLGNYSFAAATTAATLQLLATGGQRLSLTFGTNSNLQNVALVAPATATGNHVWTLPSTLGAAGQVLTLLDGGGTLTWAAAATGGVTTTGTPAANQFAFFTGANTLSSNPAFAFNAGTGVVSLLPPGSLVVGGTPFGGQAPGPVNVTVSTSDNVTPYQAILAQVVNGSSAGVIPTTIANDKVAVSGWSFRGAGGTSPIYGGHFGIRFSTTGVSNGVEIGVQNLSGVAPVGNGLWVNGSGSNHRDNAILIDTFDGSKWSAGIRFLEGATGGGATGSILNYGIVFDKSQDQDFIVIRPRVGVTTNRAIRITNTAFTANTFELWNDGTINTFGNINTANNIGAVQYFSSGIGGFTGGANLTKAGGGSCVLTITGGLVTGSNC